MEEQPQGFCKLTTPMETFETSTSLITKVDEEQVGWSHGRMIFPSENVVTLYLFAVTLESILGQVQISENNRYGERGR